MSPHCQIPTPFHPLEWPNILQIAQNKFFTSCLVLEIYSFSAQIYAPKKRLFNFHLLINSKRGSIVFFLSMGAYSDWFFYFLPSASGVLFIIFLEKFESFELKFHVYFLSIISHHLTG